MFAATSKHTALIASVAVAVALSIAGSADGDRGGRKRDRQAPTAPAQVRVTTATPSSVALAWDASIDNVGVAGYYIYVNAIRARISSTTFTATGLDCGQSAGVRVVSFDYAGNLSAAAEATVSTSACPDTEPPVPPDGFRQSATTQNAIVLDWNPSHDNVGVVGYGIYRNALPVASSPAPSATFSGLSCGATYRFDVDARDAAGNRSQQRAAWLRTADCSDGQAPTVPAGLAVTAATTTSLTVSWSPSDDNVGVAGYRIVTTGTPYVTVTQPTATVSNLTCGTNYLVSVDAYDAAGNRSSPATATGTTQPCLQPPPPPPSSDTSPPSQPAALGVSAATAVTLSLTWLASLDNVGVTGYGVYVDGAKVHTISQPGTTLSALACGRAYTVQVDAQDGAGNRSSRASVIATTSPCADIQPPTAPSNVSTSSRTANSIALSWSPSSDNVGVVGYGLYRADVLVGTSAGTTGIFSSLTCNTNYTLAVDAFDAAGSRSTRTTVMVATTACQDTQPPAVPTGFTASNVAETSLTMTWNASTDNVSVAGYDVYRNGAKVASTSSLSAGQTQLTCGTSYTFGVAAYDTAGNSSQQAQLTRSTNPCPAPPPPPPPPPPSSGSAIERFSDLSTPWNCWGDSNRNVTMNRMRPTSACNIWQPTDLSIMTPQPAPWADGGGIFEVTTAQGAGFKVVCTPEMTAPWGGKQAWLVDVDHLTPYSSFLGTTQDWSGKFMFPVAGNPNGFPNDWHAGVLWEFHTETMSGHHIAIDGSAAGGPRLRFGVHDAAADNYRFTWADSTIAFDRWYSWRLKIKWSSGSDGFVQGWLDGQQIVDYSGPTIKSGEHPKLQFGYYATEQLRNEVLHAAIRKS